MSEHYIDQEFESKQFANNKMKEVSYDNCTFIRCDFSNTILSLCKFNDCSFEHCNLSMTQVTQSTLNNVTFKNCKILGVKFNQCHDFIFSVYFENSILDYSSFERRKMSKTKFINTSLKGVDFGYADLKQSIFSNTNMSEAIFYNTNLLEADLSTAYNYIIDPSENNIKKARFSRDSLSGLLSKFDIIIV